MPHDEVNLATLHGEYVTLINECTLRPNNSVDLNVDLNRLLELLVTEGTWTQPAAQLLIQLAVLEGSFILRNAAALAIALGVDDGERGY